MSALSGRSPRDENRSPASFGIGLADPTLAVPLVVDEATGQLQVSTAASSGFVIGNYDTVEATYPNPVTEVYTYKNTGTTIATVTVTYTDPTKAYLVSAVRT